MDNDLEWEVNEMNEAQWVMGKNCKNNSDTTSNATLMIGCEFVNYFRSMNENEVYIIPVDCLKEVGPIEELLLVNYLLYQ